MAVLSGVNFFKSYMSVPSERSNVGEAGGSVKVVYDTYVAHAPLNQAVIASGDVLSIGKIPGGARILSILISASMGGTGTPCTIAKVLADGTSTALAVGDHLAGESTIKITSAGTGQAANAFAFVTYSVA